jgi:adenylate kinase
METGKQSIGTIALMLFGPPGSGKGTIAKILKADLDMVHVSTGDILREHIAAGDELGREVKALMDAGKLVPNELVNRIIVERLKRTDCTEKGVILDGYPRTVDQAEFLGEVLQQQNFHPLVIYLDVDYNEIVSRLGARRSCPKCGAVYNLDFKPPKVAGVCDEDGTAGVLRDDDREDVIRQRLVAYEKQTQPLVEYFEKKAATMFKLSGREGTSQQLAQRACTMVRELKA